MKPSVFVFDPTKSDTQSRVRGIGRYLQVLKENFPDWTFTNDLSNFQTFKHSNSVFINPFFNLLQPPLVMKRLAQKQIAVIHDLIPLKYPDYFPIGIRGKLNVFLNKLSLKNYDRVITDSEASKKDIMKILGINEEKIKVIYTCLPKVFADSGVADAPQNDVIPVSERSERVQNLSKNFCLYVGDATWNKNLVNLAKAIKILNVTCVFVGEIFKQTVGGTGRRAPDDAQRSEHRREGNPGQNLSRGVNPWQKELKEFLEEIKDDKRFILKGYVSDEDLIQLYQKARLNILSSRDEGFGFSFLEAASQKCPSVLTDINVLHEISDNNAVFADPNNPHALADAIGQLYFHQDTRNTFGLKAWKRLQHFSSSAFRKQFLDVIQ